MGWNLFGGGASSAGKQYWNNANDALAGARAAGAQVGGIAAGQQSIASRYLPQGQASIDDLADFYRKGTTDSQRATYVNNATAPVATNFLRGQSNLTATLAGRGLGNSGLMAGGLATLEGARDTAISGAENDAARYFDQQKQMRLEDLVKLLYGTGSDAAARALGGYGTVAGINTAAAGGYNNIAGQAVQAAEADNNGLLGLVKTGASVYGMSRGQGGYS